MPWATSAKWTASCRGSINPKSRLSLQRRALAVERRRRQRCARRHIPRRGEKVEREHAAEDGHCHTARDFRQFEKRYGDKIPVFRGDLTPYWEDGACSLAGNGRQSQRRRAARAGRNALVLLCPGNIPSDEFTDAWRNVLLYDEHTWSVTTASTADKQFVKDNGRSSRRLCWMRTPNRAIPDHSGRAPAAVGHTSLPQGTTARTRQSAPR